MSRLTIGVALLAICFASTVQAGPIRKVLGKGKAAVQKVGKCLGGKCG